MNQSWEKAYRMHWESSQYLVHIASVAANVHMLSKAVWNQVVLHVWNDDVRRTTKQSFGYCPSMTFLLLWAYCVNPRRKRCQQNLNSFPLLRTGGDQYTLVLRGWILSSRTRNPITCPRMKQLTWLRIVRSGDWCLRLALSTPSGACQKWRRRCCVCLVVILPEMRMSRLLAVAFGAHLTLWRPLLPYDYSCAKPG